MKALDWQDQANCVGTDPEIFHPDKGGSTRPAKTVCKRCPVRLECLNEALSQDVRSGIWGGQSEREIRRLKTMMRAAGITRLTVAPEVHIHSEREDFKVA